MVPNGFRRSGPKPLKSLTSASTGDADGVLAFRVACLKMFAVYSLVISAPVMRGAVKARQARKNVEVWVRVICFFFPPHLFIVFSSFRGAASFLIFPSNRGRRELFLKLIPVTVAGLMLVRPSPRVLRAVEFRRGWHLLVSGSGSSL